MWKMPFLIVFLVAGVFAQDVDVLIDKFYQKLVQNPKQLSYKCYPVSMFPFFASDEPHPPLKQKHVLYTKECCSYYKFKSKEGIHLVFAGLSYYKRRGDPTYKTYRLFFYLKKDGKWVQEMDPIVVRFKLIEGGLYEPIENK